MRLRALSALCTTAALALCAFLAGCGGQGPQRKPGVPIFYPPPPSPPRLQFLVSFSAAERWLGGPDQLRQFIVGEKRITRGVIRTPYGIAARNGRIYICDLGLHCVHVIDLVKKTYGLLGERGQLQNPVNITIDAAGTKYVCDTGKRRVAVFDAQDRFVRYLGDPGRAVPSDLALRGDELVVADVAGGEVEIWSRTGQLLHVIARKGKGPGQLRRPTNVAVGADGRIFVADTVSSVVNVYDRQGRFVRSIGGPGDRPGSFARPKGIAIDPQGRIFVADAQWEVVQAFSPQGRLLLFFGGAGPKPQGMGMPAGLAIDDTSLDAFRRFVADDFQPQYLLFVANQFGKHKIGVYAFGKSKTADPTAATHPARTR